nr:uncharacterized protein c26h5.04 [Quercus suber]
MAATVDWSIKRVEGQTIDGGAKDEAFAHEQTGRKWEDVQGRSTALKKRHLSIFIQHASSVCCRARVERAHDEVESRGKLRLYRAYLQLHLHQKRLQVTAAAARVDEECLFDVAVTTPPHPLLPPSPSPAKLRRSALHSHVSPSGSLFRSLPSRYASFMMVQGPSLPAIQVLRDAAASSADRISALKQIKNDITGHQQRKEANVRHGLIEPLVAILTAAAHINGKRVQPRQTHAQSWAHDDEATLHVVLVLGTLASGGPAFIPPLMAAGVTQALLDLLSSESPPPLNTALLQTLHRLAIAHATLQDATDGLDHQPLSIFTRATTETFLAILRQTSTDAAARHQLRLVADLIAVAVRDESTKARLAQCHVLDTLAGLIVSHSVANRFIDTRGHPNQLLLSPPPTKAIPSILAAIATIISGSIYRAHCFFLSVQVREMFRGSWHAKSDQRHLFGPRYGFQSFGEPLLPLLHVPTYATMSYTTASRAFPAVAAMQSNDKKAVSMAEIMQNGSDPDHASAVVGWLLLLARSLKGSDRLAALRLLAFVNSAMDSDSIGNSLRGELLQKRKERERQLALLAVPMVVHLIQAAGETKLATSTIADQKERRMVKEQACEVLALLISGKKELQAAAAEASAIKHVCPILKKSFDAVPVARPMWSARSAVPEPSHPSQACEMGPRGMSAEMLHVMRCRRSALEAIAALTEKEDIHRKAIVEAGIVPCIVDSLKPLPQDLDSILASESRQMTAKDGSTRSVVIAACHASLSMARSVSLLRTSLLDGGLAKPIFDLLSNQDVDLQIAATEVSINLLLDFSPLREEFMSEGVTKVLAQHARTSSPALRVLSLHALKHVVQGAPKDIRVNVLEELGVGWLVSTVQGGSHDVPPLPSGGGVSVGLGAPNAAGEQVDLLNPSSMDVDETADDGKDYADGEDEDGAVMYDESSSTHYQASQLRSTLNTTARTFDSKKYLSALKEMEESATLKADGDDVALQEQAIDFIRNLINGAEECEPMLQHLFAQIGTTKFFDLLTAKLLPLHITRIGGRAVPVHHPTELVLAVVHVVLHVANASTQHRQLLMAQKPLLQAWLPHFAHPEKNVRVFSVWAVTALSHTADTADREDARLRVRDLRALGIDAAVRHLANDPELDIRERVKTAVRQLDGL